MVARMSLPPVFAFAVTLSLFYLMQYLIITNDIDTTSIEVANLVDIVRLKEERFLDVKTPPVKEPPKPVNPPVTPQLSFPGAEVAYKDVALEDPTPPGDDGIEFAMADGPMLPVVKVQPRYPSRAAARQLSGWVIVEFTVTERGTVVDPFIVASCAWNRTGSAGPCIDSPSSVFNNEAKRAVVKFKYKPQIDNGKAVATYGVQNRIIFQLSEG